MAVITLHPPRKPNQPEPDDPRDLLGNYLNMQTMVAGPIDSSKHLENIIGQSPPGSILATDRSVENIVEVYKARETKRNNLKIARRQFDLMTYESVRGARSVDKIEDWTKLDLADPGELEIGTVLILRVPTAGSGFRYFRLLIQDTGDLENEEPLFAFNGNVTTLQFEELIPHRIIVPLGIGEAAKAIPVKGISEGDYVFKTTKDIPAQHITHKTSEIMWSIRPHGLSFTGADYYLRNFPMIRVDFRELKSNQGNFKNNEYFYYPPERPQVWIDSALQESYTGRSYMNTVYRVVIRHNIKISRFPARRGVSWTAESPPDKHRYMYDVYMGDGEALEIRRYDPPIDVEDEL